MEKRSNYIDILKAIGIISIVMGHTAGWQIPFFNVESGLFVYTYHIMIFMFVSGYTFKSENSLHPEVFVGKRILSTFVLFNIYTTIFVLLHNTLFKMNLLSDTKLYGKQEMLRRILNGITFNYSETMLGAFWFLPMFLVALVLFAYFIHLGSKTKYPNSINFLIILLFASVGLAVSVTKIDLAYHIQTSLLAVPIVFLGYYSKIHWEKINRYITSYGFILAAVVILFILSLDIGQIELAKNQIINVYLFYPVTIMGMYFCLSLAKLLDKTKLSNSFAYIGRNSFHIMGLHFVSFKLIDFVASKMMNVTDVSVISKFTNSGYDIKLLYVLGGIVLPLIFVFIFKYIVNIVMKYLNRFILIK
ncbi:acyltransferase family protein [Vagococcus fluvialis]|uniref:acyltransferase family protein n=1 Tax=Vagococcus fluvialis TaxID=2738 RepID=UPI003D0D3353